MVFGGFSFTVIVIAVLHVINAFFVFLSGNIDENAPHAQMNASVKYSTQLALY